MEFMAKEKAKAKAKGKEKEKSHQMENDDDDSVVTTSSELSNHFKRLKMRTEKRSDDENQSNDESSIISGPVSTEVLSCNVFCDRQPKRIKTTHFSPEIVVTIENSNGKIVPIRALLDTGTTATILLRQFVRKGRAKSYKQPKSTVWATMGGSFTTKRKALVDFNMPAFSENEKFFLRKILPTT
jgi:hypothetical protein